MGSAYPNPTRTFTKRTITKLQIYAQLCRPIPAGIAALASVVPLYVLNGGLPVWKYGATAVTVALMNGAAFAINDYWDVAKDRIDHPNRPLPSGRVGRSQVFWLAFFLFCGALLVATALGPAPFCLVALCTLLLWHYSHILQLSGILGNMLVAGVVAAILEFGSMVAQRPWAMLYGVGFTFVYALAKEIIWDIHDCEGDLTLGIITVANRWGETRAFGVAWILLAGLLISMPVAVAGLSMVAPGLFIGFGLLMLASLAVGLGRFQLQRTQTSYEALRGWSRLSMLCGLVALLGTAIPVS